MCLSVTMTHKVLTNLIAELKRNIDGKTKVYDNMKQIFTITKEKYCSKIEVLDLQYKGC